MSGRILVLEPSKVGNQHITLIDRYLEAIRAGAEGPVEFWCAASLWAHVDSDLKPGLRHRRVPVIDPSRRRFLAKIPLEVLVTLWAILRKRREDVLLITCLFSPALFLVEWACRLLRPHNVHVVLHGELEALVDPTISPKITGFGYWCRKWWAQRSENSRLGLVCIAPFIRARLLALPSARLRADRVQVLTMPINTPADTQSTGDRAQRPRPKVCFVGYRSRMKGFDIFQRLAAARPEFDWLAIGGGFVENLSQGDKTPLERTEDFRAAISDCDIALYPYEAGYDLSMSAAVLDAISAGVHVLASPRGCFLALSEELGTEIIQCHDGVEALNAALDQWLAKGVRADYRQRIARSGFGQASLNAQMQAFLNPSSLSGEMEAAR